MSDRATESTAYNPFAIFALVWAATTLVHQLAFTFWTESWQGWVLVITAVAVLFRPSCVLRFSFLIGASLVNLWNKLPFVPNHILFEGMLHLVMVAGIIGFFLFGPGRKNLGLVRADWVPRLRIFAIAVVVKTLYFLIPGVPQGYLLGAATTLFLLVTLGRMLFGPRDLAGGEDLLSRFAPVIRIGIVIVYFWAALQKMNWDYIDPAVSCAAKLHIEIASYFGGLVPTATWALQGAIWASFLFELGIPILLFFRRTRYFGFAAAVFFHLWLSIHPAAGIYSFSSLILAVLILFLPRSWGIEMQQIWDRQLAWLGRGSLLVGRSRARWIVVITFVIALLTQGALYLLIDRSYAVFEKANRVGFFVFFFWGCWLGSSQLVAGWRARGNPARFPFRPRWTIAWLALLPILLNGTLPWIGGRTQTSFSMYSNLRSEGDGNHMFLERRDWLPYQTDMVEVIDSEPDLLAPTKRPRGIQQFANPGYTILPWFEFRRLVSEMPGDFSVVYERDGNSLRLGRENGESYGDEAAFEPIPALAAKLFWFRRLKSLDGPMECTH